MAKRKEYIDPAYDFSDESVESNKGQSAPPVGGEVQVMGGGAPPPPIGVQPQTEAPPPPPAPILFPKPQEASGAGAPAGSTPPPSATPPPPAGNSGARRDRYSGSIDIPPGGDFGRLTGFDLRNFNDPLMQTMKYQAGRVFADYDQHQGAAQLMNDARFRQLFPNARVVDVDKIDFGDGQGPIDVIENYGSPQARWAWQVGGATGGGAPVGASTSRTSPGGSAGLPGPAIPYEQTGQQYAGPGSPGIYNGPVQQVGQDPLSFLISGGLADFINRGGTTPFGQEIMSAIRQQAGIGVPSAGGDIDLGTWEPQGDLGFGSGSSTSTSGPSDATLRRRYESAREMTGQARRTMTNEARAALADRGLLSEPGIPQGAEGTAIRRIEEAIAPEFSRLLRDIFTDESTRADARQMAYLQMATGLASDQAKTFLAGIGEGTARQTALADIALRSLQTNMAWSQFLAEFGLKRDSVLEMMQQGRVDDVMQLLNSFLSAASLARGGYV